HAARNWCRWLAQGPSRESDRRGCSCPANSQRTGSSAQFLEGLLDLLVGLIPGPLPEDSGQAHLVLLLPHGFPEVELFSHGFGDRREETPVVAGLHHLFGVHSQEPAGGAIDGLSEYQHSLI